MRTLIVIAECIGVYAAACVIGMAVLLVVGLLIDAAKRRDAKSGRSEEYDRGYLDGCRVERDRSYNRGWSACYESHFPVHPLGHPVSRATIESLIGSRVVEAES